VRVPKEQQSRQIPQGGLPPAAVLAEEGTACAEESKLQILPWAVNLFFEFQLAQRKPFFESPRCTC
jgi:hypothetical protein